MARSLLAGLLAVTAPAAGDSTPGRVDVPPADVGAATLEARARLQRQAAASLKVRHDFGFEDRLEESGISFVHRATEDSGRHYKLVHYDHGNGVAAADVDGDGLLDLYFSTQLGRNELWKNLGDGRFRDVTDEAGVGLGDRIGVTASFADVDNDGDPDLFVTTVRTGNALFENDGDGRFRDVTGAAGLAYSGHSSGATFLDYDNDGRLDLFVSNVGVYTKDERGPGDYWIGIDPAFDGHLHPERFETNVLYRNLGEGRFEDVTERVGLRDATWSGDASFADLDGDGLPDLYVLNMQGDDRFYLNQDGERFVERTADYFPATPWGSMGIGFFDWNNDARTDLVLTDMHSDMSQQVGPEEEKLKSDVQWDEEYLQGGGNNVFGNAFYENDGEPPYEEISDLVGAENYWPWGLSVGDLNADGFEDVFIAASMSYPWRYGVNSVLLNDGGAFFRDAEFLLGVEPRSGGRTKVPWFEADCSGAEADHPACEGREGPVTVYGNLGTRSSILLDIEGDGDLDIVTNEFHAAPQVLVSDLAERHPIHWLKVELTGTSSNRDGLGARVSVTAGGATQHRYHHGKSGYLSQSSTPLYFGLGAADTIDKVEVRWPSGAVQTLTEDLPVDGLLEITEK